MEDKAIEDILNVLLPMQNWNQETADRREALRWALKELINVAAAKGRGQIQ